MQGSNECNFTACVSGRSAIISESVIFDWLLTNMVLRLCSIDFFVETCLWKKQQQQQQTYRVSLLLVRIILEENLLTSFSKFQQRIAVT